MSSYLKTNDRLIFHDTRKERGVKMKVFSRFMLLSLWTVTLFVWPLVEKSHAASVTQDLIDRLKEKGILTEEEYREFTLRAKEEERRRAKSLQAGWDGRPFIRTQDGTNEIKFGTRIQEDFRIYEKNDRDLDSGFKLRRAYLEVEGKLLKDWLFSFIADFGNDQSRVLYAHMDYTAFPWLNFRVGQDKEPFGMEELTSDKWLDLIERSMVTRATTPEYNRGIMLYGKVLDEKLGYQLGYYNSGNSSVAGAVGGQDVAGRIEAKPFLKTNTPIEDLQLGFNFTAGNEDSYRMKPVRDPSLRDVLPRIEADGSRHRLGGDIVWTKGPGSFKGEYIYTKTGRENGLSDIEVSGFYVGGTYLVTGEKKRHSKGVIPKKNFDPRNRGWGALEIAARYGQMYVDDDGGKGMAIAPGEGFDMADNIISNKVDAIEIGLNWYLNPFMKFAMAYSHAMYGKTGPGLSPHVGGSYENNYDFILGRFQFAF